MTVARPTVALTSGEPAGIGPELCAMLAREALPARIVTFGDRALLDGCAEIHHVPLRRPRVPGTLDAGNAPYVIGMLDAATEGCLAGRYDAMVTAPVQKSVLNDGGYPFTGHTEYLAEKARAEVVMMLVGGGLRVALATTHLPLAGVPAALTRAGLLRTLRIVDADLRRRFGLARPRILVAGLNPHSGESGHLGREDIDVVAPAIADAVAAGIDAAGPVPADTLFVPERLKDAHCVLAMYHDQGLPVLKYASFGRGVNVTLGLPFVRTSVDHGTALDLAGTGRADPGSLIEAVKLAIELDRDLAEALKARFPSLVLHPGDALEFDFARLPKGMRVVGNLPYNISTPILFHLAEFSARVRDMHFMLQREVVERMVAAPSTEAYGRLSVSLQARFRMTKLLDVAPGAFRPPPRVDSAVVRLEPLESPLAVDEDMLRRAFSARRKTLRNALPEVDFSALGIDAGLRPENLSPADYARITSASR